MQNSARKATSLSIVMRMLSRREDETVSVESTLGKGSTFRVWMPLHARQ